MVAGSRSPWVLQPKNVQFQANLPTLPPVPRRLAPSWPWKTITTFGCAVALVLPTASVAAEERPQEPVRFEYRAPADCPGESEFAQRVSVRSRSGRLAVPGELARSFRVTLELDASGSVGRVEFVDAEGTWITRSVRGTTCDEVASGIALVTALAIDARTDTNELKPDPAAKLSVEPQPPTPPLPLPVAPERITPRARSGAQLTAGIGGGYVGWLGPGGGVGVDVFLAGSLSKRGPALRLSGIHVRSSGSVGAREARFRAWGGRVDLCPLTGVSGMVFFQPCGGVDFGSLQAFGVESAALPKPLDAAAGFLDLLLIGRFGVVLERRLVLELRGELSRPLLTHEFGFERPYAVVFRPPFLALGAAAGVGVRFP
jgi:hypothetical protein